MGNRVNGKEWIDKLSIPYGKFKALNLGVGGDFSTAVDSLETQRKWDGGGQTGGFWGADTDWTVYRFTGYVGLREDDGKFNAVYLAVKDSYKGSLGSADTVFYFPHKKDRTWAPDEVVFSQYAGKGNFKAKTPEEYSDWLMYNGIMEKPSGTVISGPFLPGTRPGGSDDTSVSRPDAGFDAYYEEPTTTGGNSGASRALFEEAMYGTPRLESKLTEHRVSMRQIANRATKSFEVSVHPRGQTASAMAAAINDALEDAGYTDAQIEWYYEGGVTDPGNVWGLSNQAGSTTIGSSPPAPKITPPTPAVKRIVVRGPVGYTEPAARLPDSKPYIQQVYAGQAEPDRHFFHNIPNTVSYQGLGSRWVEIPRKGDFPIVEWSDWALMKVSFDFLIAHEMDGLYKDVADDIDQLRRMSQRPYPVSVFGLDQLFAFQMKRAQGTGRAMQFVIANFTVKSARRTVGEGDKQISAAQCQITLQEIPIENMKIVEMTMPALSGPTVPSPPGGDEESSSPDMPSELGGVQSNIDKSSILTP